MISRVMISIIELQIREEIYDILRIDKSKYIEYDTKISNFKKNYYNKNNKIIIK